MSTNKQPRVAVVTGANRGIGQEIARQLRARGLDVIATARQPSREAPVQLDVTNAEQRDAIARRLEADGGFDVLVNNAAVSLDGFDASVAARTLETNFFAPMHLTDRLLPLLRAGGRVVMVSSGLGDLSVVGPALRARFDSPTLARAELVALMESFVNDVRAGVHAKRGWPTSAYSVSKVGLNALTRVLARELEGDARGIAVNAACPGWVRTRMGGAGAPRSVEEGAETPVWLATLPEGAPSGKLFRDEKPIQF